MLADERMSESGITRSLGFKRSDLRALAVFEGLLTSCLAAILGSVIGLFLALVISDAFSEIFSSVGASRLDFAASLNSIIDGASMDSFIDERFAWRIILDKSPQHRRCSQRIPTHGRKGCFLGFFVDSYCVFGAAPLGGLILLVTGKRRSDVFTSFGTC